jgi:hypothetical protein
MAEFLYLYRGTEPATAKLSPQQMQEYMQAFQRWIGELAAAGRLGACAPLTPSGRTLSGRDGVASDGPYAEAKDLVGGYTVVTATDLDEATNVARGCPFLTIGGSVEIRPVIDIAKPM